MLPLRRRVKPRKKRVNIISVGYIQHNLNSILIAEAEAA